MPNVMSTTGGEAHLHLTLLVRARHERKGVTLAGRVAPGRHVEVRENAPHESQPGVRRLRLHIGLASSDVSLALLEALDVLGIVATRWVFPVPLEPASDGSFSVRGEASPTTLRMTGVVEGSFSLERASTVERMA